MLVFSVFFQTLFLFIATREIPSFVQLCKRRDPELAKCFTNSLYKILPYLAKGVPELNFPPIEPIQFERITINSGNAKDVNVEAELTNLMVAGLTAVEIRNFTINLDNATFTTSMYFPNLLLAGQYKIKGKFMLFELDTVGPVTSNITGVSINVKYAGSFHTRDGQQYLTINEIMIPAFNISKVSVHYGNLFPNNEELTEVVNQAVNENIYSLMDSMRPIIENSLVKLTLHYYNLVFDLYPLSQLFPDD